MSYLEFSDSLDQITIRRTGGRIVASFEANNNVTKSSNGKWPDGRYTFAYWVAHADHTANTSYGSNGNFVFDVPGRTGMGVHSGRANQNGPDHVTLGCIRTTDAGTARILEIHNMDPLTHINVG